MVGNSLRTCIDCGKKAFSDRYLVNFVKDKGSKHGRRNLCLCCQYLRNKRYTEENQKKIKDWKTDHQTRKRYGIDAVTYKERMKTSKQCQICSSKSKLVYDHCHDTMKFRGVLCNKCNRSLGALGDTKEAIQKVLDYLTKL